MWGREARGVFTSVAHIAVNKRVVVSEYAKVDGSQFFWDITFRRQLNNWNE